MVTVTVTVTGRSAATATALQVISYSNIVVCVI